MTLYDIETDLQELEAALLEAGGELDEEMEARYGDLLSTHTDKIEGYVRMIANMRAMSEMFKHERERLQTKERACARSADYLKRRLAQNMTLRGDAVHKTPTGKVTLYPGRDFVVLDVNEEDLPPEFQRIKIEADKEALKAAIQAGGWGSDSYAHLAPGTPYIKIS